DAVVRLVPVLEGHPVPDRTQVVPQLEGAGGRLDPREHATGTHGRESPIRSASLAPPGAADSGDPAAGEDSGDSDDSAPGGGCGALTRIRAARWPSSSSTVSPCSATTTWEPTCGRSPRAATTNPATVSYGPS